MDQMEQDEDFLAADGADAFDDTQGYEDAPPGEEGGEISHAGGDYQVFSNVVHELSNLPNLGS